MDKYNGFRFRHIRYADGGKNDCYNFGGVTLAHRVVGATMGKDPDIGVFQLEVGLSICSFKDRYVRAKGRESAVKNYDAGKFTYNYDLAATNLTDARIEADDIVNDLVYGVLKVEDDGLLYDHDPVLALLKGSVISL